MLSLSTRIVRTTRFSRSLLMLRDTGDFGAALSTNTNVHAGDLVVSCPVPPDEIGSAQDKQNYRSMQIGHHLHWDIRGQMSFSQNPAQHLLGHTSPHIIKYALHANDPNCRLDVVTPADGSGHTWVTAAEEDFVALARHENLFVNVYARRDIRAGGLLSYNFNSFEEELGDAFTCMFSHRDIKGFKFLEPSEKQALFDSGISLPHIAEQAPHFKRFGLKENGEFGKALATFESLREGDIAMINYIQPHELVTVERKCMHSIQIGSDVHWDNTQPQHLVKMGQHAYNPSCRLDVMTYDASRSLVTVAESEFLACAKEMRLFLVLSARRDLEPGDLLTYNYNSFEDNISCTFTDVETGKLVGGFPKCGAEERVFIVESGIAFPHISRMAERGWFFEGSGLPVHM